MGVDGPRGRTEVGRGRVAAWLLRPFRTERFSVASARPADEVAARLADAESYVPAWHSDVVSVRHWRDQWLISVSYWVWNGSAQPRAAVAVASGGDGSVVSGEIGLSRWGKAWLAFVTALLPVMFVVGVVDRAPRPILMSVGFGVGVYATVRRGRRHRALLRSLVELVAS